MQALNFLILLDNYRIELGNSIFDLHQFCFDNFQPSVFFRFIEGICTLHSDLCSDALGAVRCRRVNYPLSAFVVAIRAW